jgi:hypothetical protein
MSFDLILGETTRNWSRTPACAGNESSSSGVSRLFESTPGSREAEREDFEKEIAGLKTQDQINDVARMITFNKAYAGHVARLSLKGNDNAKRVLASALKYKASLPTPPSIAGSSLGAFGGRRRRPHQPGLQRLQSRAAAGDTRATARLQKVQQRMSTLQTQANAGDQQAAAKLQRLQRKLGTQVAPSTAPPVIPSTTPYGAPPALSSSNPYGSPAAFSPSTSQYPPLPYDPEYEYYYTNTPTPSPTGPLPQPTIDVFVGEEERALAAEGGQCERAALRRRTGSMGYNRHWNFIKGDFIGASIPHDTYRATVVKQAIKAAGGKKPTTKDFFRAKEAVDKVIGKAGISLYLPGAQPGRRTV